MDGRAIVWDFNTGDPIYALVNSATLTAVVISPDSQQAFTTCMDDQAIIWDLNTGRRIHSLIGRRCVTVTPNGNYVVTDAVRSRGGFAYRSSNSGYKVVLSGDYGAVVWDINSGEPVTRISVPEPISFVLAGRHCVVLGHKSSVSCFDLPFGLPF